MASAIPMDMCAKCLEELQVYQKALDAADAVSALLKRPSLQRDNRLRDQLGDSSEAVPALIADGFPQSTDKFFAQFLYRARGESSETRTHLLIAKGRGYLTETEQIGLCEQYNE